MWEVNKIIRIFELKFFNYNNKLDDPTVELNPRFNIFFHIFLIYLFLKN